MLRAIDKRLHNKYHHSSGKYVKSFVYGGLDGIITTFAVVAGAAGASLGSGIVLILGFANLFADGISMAVGDYLSTKSEVEYGKAEKKVEESHVKKSKKHEINSLIKIYMKKGFSKKDSIKLAGILCKNKDVCVDILLADELGITQENKHPWKNALTTFLSFAFFGFIPLLAFVLGRVMNIGNVFNVAIILTGITFFILGSVKVKITGKNWVTSGIETLVIGGVTALVAWLIGHGLAGLA